MMRIVMAELLRRRRVRIRREVELAVDRHRPRERRQQHAGAVDLVPQPALQLRMLSANGSGTSISGKSVGPYPE